MNKSILIISRGFKSGDAITTLNLFSKWPHKNLFCASLTNSEFRDRFEGFYFIGDKEIKYSFPFNYISKPQKSNCESSNETINIAQNTNSSKKSLYQRWIRPTLQWLDLYENRLEINLSKEFTKWIETISPSMIYTSIGDIAMANFIIKIHKHFPQIKIVTHGFDNWINPSYNIWNSTFHRLNAEKLLRKILSFSAARFTSSEMMAKDYARQYGFSFKCFPNPVEIPDASIEVKKKIIPNIIFIGKIGWHNAVSIKIMAKVVSEINNSGTRVDFDLYTSTSVQELTQHLGVLPETTVVHSAVPNNQIANILSSAHLLFLPISITRQTQKFTQYSMSTKMGEYLSTGTPMIYMGPPKIAMTEFLKDKDCAYVITENNINKLKKTILEGLNSQKNNRSIEIANQFFNKEVISTNFKKELEYILSL